MRSERQSKLCHRALNAVEHLGGRRWDSQSGATLEHGDDEPNQGIFPTAFISPIVYNPGAGLAAAQLREILSVRAHTLKPVK